MQPGCFSCYGIGQKDSNMLPFSSLVVDEKSQETWHCSLVEVGALSFLQCFDTVGWVTGRTSSPQKNLCQLSPEILFQNRWRKSMEREPAK